MEFFATVSIELYCTAPRSNLLFPDMHQTSSPQHRYSLYNGGLAEHLIPLVIDIKGGLFEMEVERASYLKLDRVALPRHVRRVSKAPNQTLPVLRFGYMSYNSDLKY
jgi:hypothetical protein